VNVQKRLEDKGEKEARQGSDPETRVNQLEGGTFLICEEVPEGVTVSGMGPGHRLRLDPDTDLVIGNSELCDLVVGGVRMGGQKTCRLQGTGTGSWELSHLGHALPILVNGASLLEGCRLLKDGDWFQPEGPYGEAGPRFRLIQAVYRSPFAS
jgi:hypothetical protein